MANNKPTMVINFKFIVIARNATTVCCSVWASPVNNGKYEKVGIISIKPHEYEALKAGTITFNFEEI